MPIHNARVSRPTGWPMLVMLSSIASVAMADDQQQSQQETPTVVVTGQKENTESAIAQTPTLTPLDATQPTAAISQYFIQNNMPLTANYAETIGISPSVQSVSPNGAGLMENQILSIRGFVDGYYNVTFDGIPFQDSNDFTHHSTSYFMSHDLGGINVNYGPGTAATIGNATFCCSIDNISKAPLQAATLTPYVSFGSWHTQVFGAQFDSGKLDRFDGA